MIELIDCYLPVFKLVIQITSDPINYTDYKSSRDSCISKLELADKNAEYTDTSEDEKLSARFAIIAWMDEIILRSLLSWRQYWQSELLQRKYLDITTAGEHFFTLLKDLPHSHNQARKVFLFCLQNDFRGRYIILESRPELLKIIESQRGLCLSEEWQSWPNETAITPFFTTPCIVTPYYRNAWLRILFALVFLYGLLFSFLYQCV